MSLNLSYSFLTILRVSIQHMLILPFRFMQYQKTSVVLVYNNIVVISFIQ
jgi:hypothetical protein